MKWPLSLTLVRHGQSAYNALRQQKFQDEKYRRFVELYDKRSNSPDLPRLAKYVEAKFAIEFGDYDTPLTEEGEKQALVTGQRMSKVIPQPDFILYSPYRRTRQTLAGLRDGWEVLNSVPSIEDDRIREQDHGLALLYSDWRVFNVNHPKQRQLREKQGPYWYQFPQGESVAMVRDRVRSVLTTLVREHNGKHVMLVTHHLMILSIRATLERLTPERFIELDNKEKPINCGVTVYEGRPNLGDDGKLILSQYNQKLY